MKRFGYAGLCFLLLLLAGCSSVNQASMKPETCLKNKPKTIPGLKIKGARSEQNVIHNLWPLVCKTRQLYRERLKETPKLTGTLELKLYVEFNGEIGPFEITCNKLEDPSIERKLRNLIEFMDFDPYGPDNSDSEVVLPIHFTP